VSERLKLPALFSRLIAESLDADAAGQAAFYGCSDKIWSEEGEREAALAAGRANALAASMRGFLCSPLVVVGKGLKLISNR
jgi:hypothetical protein